MRFEFKRLPHTSSCYTVVLLPCFIGCRKGTMLELGVLWLNWSAMVKIGRIHKWTVE